MDGRKFFLCLDRIPARLPTELITLTVYFVTFLPVSNEAFCHLFHGWVSLDDLRMYGPVEGWIHNFNTTGNKWDKDIINSFES